MKKVTLNRIQHLLERFDDRTVDLSNVTLAGDKFELAPGQNPAAGYTRGGTDAGAAASRLDASVATIVDERGNTIIDALGAGGGVSKGQFQGHSVIARTGSLSYTTLVEPSIKSADWHASTSQSFVKQYGMYVPNIGITEAVTLDQNDTNTNTFTSGVNLTNFQTVGNMVKVKFVGFTSAVTGTPTALTLIPVMAASDGTSEVLSLATGLNVAAPTVTTIFWVEFMMFITAVGSSGGIATHYHGYKASDGATKTAAPNNSVAVNFSTQPYFFLRSDCAAGADGSNHATTTGIVTYEFYGTPSA